MKSISLKKLNALFLVIVKELRKWLIREAMFMPNTTIEHLPTLQDGGAVTEPSLMSAKEWLLALVTKLLDLVQIMTIHLLRAFCR